MAKSIVRDAGQIPVPPQEGNAPPNLSPEQIGEILQKIAVTADATRACACRVAEGLGDDDAKQVFCLVYLLDQIGALADYGLNGQKCVGDFGRWLIGPLFHKEGSHV
jgi:hypothetical protein